MFLKDSTIAPFFQYTLFFLILILLGLVVYYTIYIGNKAVSEKNKIIINWKFLAKLFLVILAIISVIALYKHYKILRTTSFAVFLSILVAFLLNPIVNKLENYGIKRGLGTIITYFIILFIIIFMFVSILPDLINQITSLFSNLPNSINDTYNTIQSKLQEWNIDANILDNFRIQINDYLLRLSNNIPEWSEAVIKAIQGSISTLVTIVLVPLISYYFIVDKEKIIKKVYKIIPSKVKPDAKYLYKEILFAMNEFIRNRIIMAIFIGVATGIMLQLFGIPFAWVIGFLTMVLDIVPYIGPVMATVPALIFAFIKSPIIFVWILVLSWFLQWIEQNIVGTKLFSGASGIHEVIILLSIIIGGGILGVWGMILSVPTILIIRILFEYIILKLKGVTPTFTKDIEKEKLLKLKAEEKAKKKMNRDKK